MGHQEDIVKTESKIIVIRDTQVILDRDVAELYGIETRDINKAVKNNPKKFPPGYVIELNNNEKEELIKNFDRFKNSNIPLLLHMHLQNKGFTCLPLKMRKLTFGVNLGILKFSLETTRESKE